MGSHINSRRCYICKQLGALLRACCLIRYTELACGCGVPGLQAPFDVSCPDVELCLEEGATVCRHFRMTPLAREPRGKRRR